MTVIRSTIIFVFAMTSVHEVVFIKLKITFHARSRNVQRTATNIKIIIELA